MHPRTTGAHWQGVRKAASSAPAKNLVAQASEILGENFSPDRFLLTHCTIVASVDTDPVPNVKLGSEKVGSKVITRKWADFYIKPDCAQFVNNNGDSWSRDVLLKSYRTFIGAHNFLEHVQIEEQSKGRIIDAVARDIGDSLYIDILVATDRKHAQLVSDIEAGRLGTLSMGCTCEFTLCSQCGNVAVDETDLCDHIKYAKLNTFFDDGGKKRIIAELCGHTSHGDTGGVRFIEASWVAVPAFAGAVMRNIIDPAAVSAELGKQANKILSSPPPEWGTGVQRAASLENRLGGFGEEEPAAEAPAEPAPPPLPFQDIEDQLYETLKNKVRERLEKDISSGNVEKALGTPTSPNDSIIREARRHHQGALTALQKVASNDASLVEGVMELDRQFGLVASSDVYRTALLAGDPARYLSPDEYLRACHKLARRVLSPAEVRVVVRVGKLLSRKGSTLNHRNREEY